MEVLTVLTLALSPQNIQRIYLLYLLCMINLKGRYTLLDCEERKTFVF